jgi:hypothetical protein
MEEMFVTGFGSMDTQKRPQKNDIPPRGERKGILLNPGPGEIWAAMVDDEAIAYGKTLKEAREKALRLCPEAEPSMFLIAWLWDIGFFDEPDPETGEVRRAVWI